MNATESNAMKHARLLFCLGVLMVSAAPALAKPAYVASTVNLRAAPGTTSEIVGKIPGGSLIDAKDCSEGWCAVTWQEKSGFAIQTALDLSGRVPRRAARPPAYPAPCAAMSSEDEPDYDARRRRSIITVPITGRIGVGAGIGGERRRDRPLVTSPCRRRPIAGRSPTLTAR